MKINKKQLQRIIKEEVDKYLREDVDKKQLKAALAKAKTPEERQKIINQALGTQTPAGKNGAESIAGPTRRMPNDEKATRAQPNDEKATRAQSNDETPTRTQKKAVALDKVEALLKNLVRDIGKL